MQRRDNELLVIRSQETSKRLPDLDRQSGATAYQRFGGRGIMAAIVQGAVTMPSDIILPETPPDCERGPCVADNSVCGDIGDCEKTRGYKPGEAP